MAKVRKVGLLFLWGCAREFVRANKREKDDKKGKGERERGRKEGGGEAARTNVGDVQVATVANTLGRLRIMMPYCIQIRIPTVARVSVYGRRHTEIALSLVETCQ